MFKTKFGITIKVLAILIIAVFLFEQNAYALRPPRKQKIWFDTQSFGTAFGGMIRNIVLIVVGVILCFTPLAPLGVALIISGIAGFVGDIVRVTVGDILLLAGVDPKTAATVSGALGAVAALVVGGIAGGPAGLGNGAASAANSTATTIINFVKEIPIIGSMVNMIGSIPVLGNILGTVAKQVVELAATVIDVGKAGVGLAKDLAKSALGLGKAAESASTSANGVTAVPDGFLDEVTELAPEELKEVSLLEQTEEVTGEFLGEFGEEVGENVGEKIGAEIGKEYGNEALGKEIGKEVGKEVGEKLAKGEITIDELAEEIYAEVGKEIGGRIAGSAGAKIGENIGRKMGKDVDLTDMKSGLSKGKIGLDDVSGEISNKFDSELFSKEFAATLGADASSLVLKDPGILQKAVAGLANRVVKVSNKVGLTGVAKWTANRFLPGNIVKDTYGKWVYVSKPITGFDVAKAAVLGAVQTRLQIEMEEDGKSGWVTNLATTGAGIAISAGMDSAKASLKDLFSADAGKVKDGTINVSELETIVGDDIELDRSKEQKVGDVLAKENIDPTKLNEKLQLSQGEFEKFLDMTVDSPSSISIDELRAAFGEELELTNRDIIQAKSGDLTVEKFLENKGISGDARLEKLYNNLIASKEPGKNLNITKQEFKDLLGSTLDLGSDSYEIKGVDRVVNAIFGDGMDDNIDPEITAKVVDKLVDKSSAIKGALSPVVGAAGFVEGATKGLLANRGALMINVAEGLISEEVGKSNEGLGAALSSFVPYLMHSIINRSRNGELSEKGELSLGNILKTDVWNAVVQGAASYAISTSGAGETYSSAILAQITSSLLKHGYDKIQGVRDEIKNGRKMTSEEAMDEVTSYALAKAAEDFAVTSAMAVGTDIDVDGETVYVNADRKTSYGETGRFGGTSTGGTEGYYSESNRTKRAALYVGRQVKSATTTEGTEPYKTRKRFGLDEKVENTEDYDFDYGTFGPFVIQREEPKLKGGSSETFDEQIQKQYMASRAERNLADFTRDILPIPGQGGPAINLGRSEEVFGPGTFTSMPTKQNTQARESLGQGVKTEQVLPEGKEVKEDKSDEIRKDTEERERTTKKLAEQYENSSEPSDSTSNLDNSLDFSEGKSYYQIMQEGKGNENLGKGVLISQKEEDYQAEALLNIDFESRDKRVGPKFKKFSP